MQWNLVSLPIKDLKDHSKNPRQISKENFERLSQTIDKFGLIDKPIVNADMTIIGGHQRVKVLKKKKVKLVECWVAIEQLSDENLDELCIGLNLHQGTWDSDILANQWDMAKLLDYGFSEEYLLQQAKEAEEILSEEIDEDEIALQEEKDATTQIGDLYELGPHRLVCGDSTDTESVKKVLGGAEPILMVTDPPYGVNYDSKWRKDKRGSLSKKKVLNDDQCSWPVAYALFPGSVAYIWCASLHIYSVLKDIKSCEFECKSLIIWNKEFHMISRGDYHWKHETCIYSIKKGHTHNWQGSRKENTVWDIKSCKYSRSGNNEKTEHSTQKPVECMARPIRNNTAKGEGVYDPFLGSGTTIIAADMNGRICYGIELSRAYCDMIVKRYSNYMKKKGASPDIKRNGEPFSAAK